MSAVTDHEAIEAKAEPVRYEQDSYGWTMRQVDLLRDGNREALDLPHLAQVLAGLAAQDRGKLGAAMEQILAALLKWDHAPEARQRAWSLTLHQQRRRVLKQVRRQPGLMSALPDVMRLAYAVAREAAIAELGLDAAALPLECGYAWADMTERPIAWLDA